MGTSDQTDRLQVQPFGFHQLRQACEISTLRQEIGRILAGTAELQVLIEHEVEQVRQHLGALSPQELNDPAKLSPLLSEALTALLEIREAARRLESARETDPAMPPPPRPAAAPSPPRLTPTQPMITSAPPPEGERPAPQMPPAPPAPPSPAPAAIRPVPPPPAVPAATAPPAASPGGPASPLAASRPAISRAKALNWLMPANR